MAKKSVKDFDLDGKRVLMRVDFNVPLDENLQITDDNRISMAMPTIEYVLAQGASLILMSHLGRPKGEVKPEFSLRPACDHLSKLLGKEVKLAGDCIGNEVDNLSVDLEPGNVLLLENLRFHNEEEANNPIFAQKLASNADIYINDAFGTSHRAHASTEGVAKFLPSGAGLLLDKELTYFDKTLENPKRPFVAILGGAKVKDKIPVIFNLLNKVNHLIIGGGMAYTFLKHKGIKIGDSLLDESSLPLIDKILEKAKDKGVEVLLPSDFLVADAFNENANTQVIKGDIPDGWEGIDIGPESMKKFGAVLKESKSVIWNGPVGVFEIEKFAEGTKFIAKTLAELTDTTTIIGGGDTAAAVKIFGYANKMSHISTGGGASLELLEGKILPGVSALNDL
ncbi:MAG: phosphoglycerate kinase [Planctomycetota bacterium]|nr:MAG: phosphoglycerate kinase [Planctomycetota bacterium]